MKGSVEDRDLRHLWKEIERDLYTDKVCGVVKRRQWDAPSTVGG